MAKAFAFSQRTANRLLEISRQFGQYTEPGIQRTSNYDKSRPILVRNDSGEEAPGFACLQVTGAEDDLGYVTTITKPDGAAHSFVINGPYPIANGEYGTAYAGYVRAGYTGSQTPLTGESWGPRAGEWLLSPDGDPAITVFGITDATDKILCGITGGIRQTTQFFKVPQDVSNPVDPLVPSLVQDCIRMDIDVSTGELVESTETADIYFRFCCPTDTYVEAIQIDGVMFATGRHRGDEFGDIDVADVQYILAISDTGCVGRVGTQECAPSGIQSISSGSTINGSLGSFFEITGGTSPYSITGTNPTVNVYNNSGSSITVEGVSISNGSSKTFVYDGTSSYDDFGPGAVPL